MNFFSKPQKIPGLSESAFLSWPSKANSKASQNLTQSVILDRRWWFFITSSLCCLLPIWLLSFSCSTLLKKCSFMILSKRSLRLLSLLHFSVKCFKSHTPVEPWKTKSLLTHPVSQLSLSYSVLEKVHVYAFPKSMDCSWLKTGSGPPTTLKWSRHLQLRAS